MAAAIIILGTGGRVKVTSRIEIEIFPDFHGECRKYKLILDSLKNTHLRDDMTIKPDGDVDDLQT